MQKKNSLHSLGLFALLGLLTMAGCSMPDKKSGNSSVNRTPAAEEVPKEIPEEEIPEEEVPEEEQPVEEQLQADEVMMLLAGTAWKHYNSDGSTKSIMTYHSTTNLTEDIFNGTGTFLNSRDYVISPEGFDFDKKTGKPYLSLRLTEKGVTQKGAHLIYFAEGSGTSLGEQQEWNVSTEADGSIEVGSGILYIKE